MGILFLSYLLSGFVLHWTRILSPWSTPLCVSSPPTCMVPGWSFYLSTLGLFIYSSTNHWMQEMENRPDGPIQAQLLGEITDHGSYAVSEERRPGEGGAGRGDDRLRVLGREVSRNQCDLCCTFGLTRNTKAVSLTAISSRRRGGERETLLARHEWDWIFTPPDRLEYEQDTVIHTLIPSKTSYSSHTSGHDNVSNVSKQHIRSSSPVGQAESSWTF
ncbi:uncharacterized protein [Danio rerio]|uniref:Uncharacterized protein n=1 Tax=Danio rerio TaxID=7955 RepID=A0AC58H761_DANRE